MNLQETAPRNTKGKYHHISLRAAVDGLLTVNSTCLLLPVNQALRDSGRFSRKLQRLSSYRKLAERHTGDPDAISLNTLRDTLCGYLDNAKGAEARLDRKRGSSQRTTQFLLTFNAYLDAFSNVVELLSAAGGEYGKAAYGALSIFLTVCRWSHGLGAFLVRGLGRQERIRGVLTFSRSQ